MDLAVPARREIAGVETVQRQRQFPVQHRVPAGLAAGLQGAGGHGRLQRMDLRPRGIAAHIQHHLRLLAVALQGGVAVGRPFLDGAGHAQRRIQPDHRGGRIGGGESQVLRVEREIEAGVLRLGEIGRALEPDLAAVQLQRQRRHSQDLVFQVQA